MKVVWEESLQIEGQLPSVYGERCLGARCCTSLKHALNTQLTASRLQILRDLNSKTYEIMNRMSSDHYIETRSKEIRKWPSLNRKLTCFPGVTVVMKTETLISARRDLPPSCIPQHVYNSQHTSDEQGKILLFPLSTA
jgi:hypothetical protein